MTPYQAGLFAAAAYPPAPTGTFQHVFTSATVTVGVGIDENGEQTFAFAGSRDPRDFADDAFALPIYVEGVGHVHAGFWAGMQDMFTANLLPLLVDQQPKSAEGHSLGCPHAEFFAVMAARAGFRIKTLVLLEPPRAGFADFCTTLRASVDEVYAFKNARDPVVKVPVKLPLCEYEDTAPMIDLNNPSSSEDPFEDHMLAQVLPGLKRWQDAQAAT